MESKPNHVLALDIGTFSARCLLFSHQGELIDSARQRIELARISTREIEQDAGQILVALQLCLDQVLQRQADKISVIRSAGMATQRSSIVAWRPSSGEIVSPLLSWQDTRAYRKLEACQDQADRIQRLTGLRLTAHYGASKMQWLLEQDAGVAAAATAGDCVITPLASLVLHHISDLNSIVIDSANASRTLLFNLMRQDWDMELIRLFDMDPRLLPRVLPIQHDYGTIKGSRARLTCVNGDQTAALYCNGRTREASLYVNLGTGAFVLTPVSEDLLRTEAFQLSGLLAGISRNDISSRDYYIEGTVNGAAAALDWLQDFDQTIDLDQMLQLPMPQQVELEVIFFNAVGGIGSPVWRSDVRPHFIDDSGQAADRLQAVLESMIFLLMMNIEAMLQVKAGIDRIEISGGLSNHRYLCQCLADLSGFSVVTRPTSEATARGIAWLAMQDHSHWINARPDRHFQPQANLYLHKRYSRFRDYLV